MPPGLWSAEPWRGPSQPGEGPARPLGCWLFPKIPLWVCATMSLGWKRQGLELPPPPTTHLSSLRLQALGCRRGLRPAETGPSSDLAIRKEK